MKIRDLRHLVYTARIMLVEEMSTITGKRNIETIIDIEQLYRYDEITVTGIYPLVIANETLLQIYITKGE